MENGREGTLWGMISVRSKWQKGQEEEIWYNFKALEMHEFGWFEKAMSKPITTMVDVVKTDDEGLEFGLVTSSRDETVRGMTCSRRWLPWSRKSIVRSRSGRSWEETSTRSRRGEGHVRWPQEGASHICIHEDGTEEDALEDVWVLRCEGARHPGEWKTRCAWDTDTRRISEMDRSTAGAGSKRWTSWAQTEGIGLTWNRRWSTVQQSSWTRLDRKTTSKMSEGTEETRFTSPAATLNDITVQ